MNAEQIYGPLRAIIPMLTAVLVGWGLDSTTAGIIAGGIVMLLAGVWSWYSNQPAKVAAQVGALPGVQVVVGPTAPPDMRKAAANPNVLGVVAAR